MIVRETQQYFIMIEQHHHGQISGLLASHWGDRHFKGEKFRPTVEYAIEQHDCGWIAFDKEPLWNDQIGSPYTFVDLPTSIKTVLYKHGIDEIESKNAYAALLCSEHYIRFMNNISGTEAKSFVEKERKRQERIIEIITDYNHRLFNLHYALLQLCYNLSLYICLNEPGVQKENEHPFFKNGIPLSEGLLIEDKDELHLYWEDKQTIIIDPFPFSKNIEIELQQKKVAKSHILKNGLIRADKDTPIETIKVQLEK